MRRILLIREGVPLAHAILAAAECADSPQVSALFDEGADEPQIRLLDDREFERFRRDRDALVLTSSLHEGKAIAIAFAPRHEWPEEFDRLRDYFVEAEREREERENITEEKWLSWDTRPFDLANFALRRAGRRKVRLYAIACCGLVAGRIADPRSRRAVEVAWRHADGRASDDVLAEAAREAKEALNAIMYGHGRAGLDQSSPEFGAAALVCNAVESLDPTPTTDSPDGWLSLCAGGTTGDFLIGHARLALQGHPSPEATLTELLREICGNPFRELHIAPEWRTPDVVALARSIYDTGEFDRLPQLATALRAAGCRESSILEHCDQDGPHVRGCWVVDLMLGFPAG